VFDFPAPATLGQQVVSPTGAVFLWDGAKWGAAKNNALAAGAGFLPLSGGTVSGPMQIGTTPYGQTMFKFNPTNPRNGSAALMLNKVQGSAVGDDPQISSYWALDYNGDATPYHSQIVTNATGNTGVWAAMFQSYTTSNNTGTNNGHVGLYSQTVRTGINTGGTRGINSWSGIFELRSQTGLPSSQDGVMQTVELDLLANGADDLDHSVGFGRTVMSIVIGQNDTSGAATEVSNGISFFPQAGHNAHFINVFTVATPFSKSVINTVQAVQQSNANAIWLADGHRLAWNTSGSAVTYWDTAAFGSAGGVHFTSNTEIDGSVYTPANLTVGGTTNLAGPVGGSGLNTYLASPPAIGSTTPAAGSFTTLAASSTVTGAGFTSRFAAPGPIGNTTPSSGVFTTLNVNVGPTTLLGPANWGAHNFGKQLLITSGGNPAIGITDSGGTNFAAISYAFGGLAFAAMPALSDSTTVPTYWMTLTNTLGKAEIPWRFNSTIGFNGAGPVAKPTVTGAKNANPALASLLTALAAYGLVTDSSTA
jgi:hypothetical protein